ncbi:Fc.00g106950.m01.CDS01 [Cosmosporella sp. VM-42]
MVRSTLLLTLATAVSTAFGIEKVGTKKASSSRVPGAYIFEFEDDHDSGDFFAKAASEEANTRMQFDYKLFKGASIQFDDIENAEDKAARMAALPAVKQMWPVQLYKIPTPNIEWTGEPDKDYSTAMRKRATNDTSDTFSPHVMTQVDKLRAEGITGKGIKIAVVDTGIDYKHPALGGCFGPNCLVSFGTDLAGDDYSGFNTPLPDDDPMDCAGHGTHVAGIIAAQENSFGFTGAAPDVTLGAYRVFGCEGEAGNDVLIAAFNQAFEDGADIITASIGGPSGWSEEPWAVAVSRIVEQGVPCTVSAGNSGDVGLFYASTASNGKHVTSIASFDNSKSLALLSVSHYSVNGSKEQEFGYTPSSPAAWGGIKLPIWSPSLDAKDPAAGCSAYPADTPDLSGHIVLIRRGTCTFVQKAKNAAKAGAKYIMLYNNAAGTSTFDVASVSGILATGMVTTDQGEKWIALLKAGSEVVLRVDDAKDSGVTVLEVTNKATGGALSSFTSWGPTWEMDVKPQFGTPGGSILSTYPTAKGSYAVLSGTSMACPLAAGIVALIAEVRGTLDPETIENLMSASSNPQLFNDGTAFYDFIAPVPQQGGGLVQAYDAAHAKTLLSPSSFSFNDTDHFVEVLNFTLSNTGSEEITYEISHVPAITMYTLVDGSIYPDKFPNEPATEHANLNFSESKVTLGGGEHVVIEALPTAPEGLNAKRLPVWSGYIAINGTDGTSLSLPYQGLTGSLHDSTVLGSKDTWISKSTDGAYRPITANTTFILPPPGTANTTEYTLPSLVWYLALGSSKLTADIIPANYTTNSTATLLHKSIGHPDAFPLVYNPMGSNHFDWTGELGDGSYAPAGLYKVVFRALRIFGDEKKKSDWDVSVSDVFGIKYSS